MPGLIIAKRSGELGVTIFPCHWAARSQAGYKLTTLNRVVPRHFKPPAMTHTEHQVSRLTGGKCKPVVDGFRSCRQFSLYSRSLKANRIVIGRSRLKIVVVIGSIIFRIGANRRCRSHQHGGTCRKAVDLVCEIAIGNPGCGDGSHSRHTMRILYVWSRRQSATARFPRCSGKQSLQDHWKAAEVRWRYRYSLRLRTPVHTCISS